MKLLFDQNLSFKLCVKLADLFPDSNQVRLLGLDQAEDRTVGNTPRTMDLPWSHRMQTSPIWLHYTARRPKFSGYAAATSLPALSKRFFVQPQKPSLNLSEMTRRLV